MRLLLCLHQNQGQIVTRQTLAEQVWLSSHTSDDSINRSVSRLRKLLSKKRDAFIKTVPKQGYLFTLPEHTRFTVNSDNTPQPKHKQTSDDAVLDSDKQPLQEGPKKKPNAPAPPRLVSAVIIMVVIAVILMIAINSDSPSDEQPIVNTVPKQTTLPIKLAAITINTDSNTDATEQAINAPYLISLHNQLKTELQLNNKFDFSQTNAPAVTNTHVIKIDVTQQTAQLRFSVNINNTHLDSHYYTQLDFAADGLNNNKAIINEIAAYVRLMLVASKQAKLLLSAHDPLSYAEVELLVNANTRSGWYVFDKLPHDYEAVAQLNHKYPDVAKIKGVLSRLNGLRASYGSVDMVEEKKQQLSNARSALATDPTNFDALFSAFEHNRVYPQYRSKSSDYVKSLLHYHPTHGRPWRNQLLLMIDNTMSCGKITTFVDTIPQGVFKTHRLNVINQILDACIHAKPPQLLYEQLSYLPNDKVDTSIINNIKLFEIRHDKLWQLDNRNTLVFNGLRFYASYFVHQLMRGDTAAAMSYLQQIQSHNNQYWHWYAQLYLSLYDLPDKAAALQQKAQAQEQALWRDDYFSVLQEDAEMYLAAALIKNSAHNPLSAQRIEQYLAKRPPFLISIINKKESIAKIMLLHHAGQTQQAKNAANQLYRQLERNYQSSPNSFKFWHLGRYQLIAKLYCGQACSDGQSAEQYLQSRFSPHHLWWLDDYKFMEQALKPWADQRIVKTYLQRLTSDRQRMQVKLGISLASMSQAPVQE